MDDSAPDPPPDYPPVKNISREKKDKMSKKDKRRKEIKKINLEEVPVEAAQLVEATPNKKSSDEHKEGGITDNLELKDEARNDGETKDVEAPPVRNPASERTMVVPSDPKPPNYEPGDAMPKKKKKANLLWVHRWKMWPKKKSLRL